MGWLTHMYESNDSRLEMGLDPIRDDNSRNEPNYSYGYEKDEVERQHQEDFSWRFR